jgi:hypothetical protein
VARRRAGCVTPCKVWLIWGGGSEVLVLQRRFSQVIVNDTEIAPTIEAGGAREETISQ